MKTKNLSKCISAMLAAALLLFALGTQALADVIHTVKAGDWLSKIAITYGVTVDQLMKNNSPYIGFNPRGTKAHNIRGHQVRCQKAIPSG